MENVLLVTFRQHSGQYSNAALLSSGFSFVRWFASGGIFPISCHDLSWQN